MKTRDILIQACYKVEKTRKIAKGKSDFPILCQLRHHRKDSIPKGCGDLHVSTLILSFLLSVTHKSRFYLSALKKTNIFNRNSLLLFFSWIIYELKAHISCSFPNFQVTSSHPGRSPSSPEFSILQNVYMVYSWFFLLLIYFFAGTFLKTNRELGEFILGDKTVAF